MTDNYQPDRSADEALRDGEIPAPSAGAPAGGPASDTPERFRRGPARPATIVWGMVIVAVAVLYIASNVLEYSFDPALVIIGLLVGTGLALVVAGAISAVSGRKRP